MMPMMYAHVISLSFAGEDVWAAIEMFRGSSMDLVASQPGFAGLITMGNGETGRALAFTFWNTELDVLAAAVNEHFARDLARYAHLITGPFSRDMYAVVARTSMLGPGDDAFAPAFSRVTTVGVNPGRWDDAYPALRDLVGWDGSECADLHGLTLLENRNLSRAIALEIWNTDEGLNEADRRAARFDFNARAANWMRGRPTREEFQVVVRL